MNHDQSIWFTPKWMAYDVRMLARQYRHQGLMTHPLIIRCGGNAAMCVEAGDGGSFFDIEVPKEFAYAARLSNEDERDTARRHIANFRNWIYINVFGID